jgi:sodium-dependent dicarboxylate transporter 2/3/5
MSDMVRAGVVMNFIGVVMITALIFFWGLPVLGIDPAHIPVWATAK